MLIMQLAEQTKRHSEPQGPSAADDAYRNIKVLQLLFFKKEKGAYSHLHHFLL